MKLALRGAVVGRGHRRSACSSLAAYGMEWARFSGASIIAARVATGSSCSRPRLYWFLSVPLRRRVTDEQVALYLEEHEPSLQATLLSAVEASQSGHMPESAALVRRVVEQAIEACVARGRRRGASSSSRCAATRRRWPLWRWSRCWRVVLGPAFLRNALSAMLLVSSNVEAASPVPHRGDAGQHRRCPRARTRRSPPS